MGVRATGSWRRRRFHLALPCGCYSRGSGAWWALLGGEDRCLAGLDDVLWSPNRARGVEREDLADDEPVEEHPKRREVLLDGRRRERPGEPLDVGCDHHRLDLVQREASVLAPLGEASHCREVGEARVSVPDVGSEELPEAPLGAFGGGEERQRRRGARGRGGERGAVGPG